MERVGLLVGYLILVEIWMCVQVPVFCLCVEVNVDCSPPLFTIGLSLFQNSELAVLGRLADQGIEHATIFGLYMTSQSLLLQVYFKWKIQLKIYSSIGVEGLNPFLFSQLAFKEYCGRHSCQEKHRQC